MKVDEAMGIHILHDLDKGVCCSLDCRVGNGLPVQSSGLQAIDWPFLPKRLHELREADNTFARTWHAKEGD